MPRITLQPRRLDAQTFLASMRPGRNAPDNRTASAPTLAIAKASMRPGRNAPDNSSASARARSPFLSFNEAGAKCPG